VARGILSALKALNEFKWMDLGQEDIFAAMRQRINIRHKGYVFQDECNFVNISQSVIIKI